MTGLLNYGMGQQNLAYGPMPIVPQWDPTKDRGIVPAPPIANPYTSALGDFTPAGNLTYGSNIGGGPNNGIKMAPSAIESVTSAQPVDTDKLKDGTSGWFGKGGLDKFKTLSDIVGTFGSIYAGIQANKIAKQSLAFQKSTYETNLKNQLQTYNTSLEARSNNAAVQGNRSQADADAYTAAHRLEK